VNVPVFIWPRDIQSETTVLIRLGRIVHWLCIVGACLVFLTAIIVGLGSLSDAKRSAEAAHQWDLAQLEAQRSSPPLPKGYTLDSIGGERPYVTDSEFIPIAIMGFVAGIVLAVAGRSARYVLAGE